MELRENMKDLKHFNPMKLREKYSVKSLNKTNNYSSFWLGDNWDRTTSFFDDEDEKPGVDLIAIASYRRAISNFVNIVTGKNIHVTFNSSGDSYTDGKKVTISSKLDDKLYFLESIERQVYSRGSLSIKQRKALNGMYTQFTKRIEKNKKRLDFNENMS